MSSAKDSKADVLVVIGFLFASADIILYLLFMNKGMGTYDSFTVFILAFISSILAVIFGYIIAAFVRRNLPKEKGKLWAARCIYLVGYLGLWPIWLDILGIIYVVVFNK